MLIALMADIHANREAFEACLRDAQGRGIEKMVFLGDLVGYGADPVWVVDTVMGLVAKGALALMGNHDNAVSDLRESLTTDALVAMSWTRGKLGSEAREFLAGLPMRIEDDTRLYVHANVQADRRWLYIDDRNAATRALHARQAQAVFCGHVHIPAIYGITATEKIVTFHPVSGVAVPLSPQRRWLAVLGAVGQPRDDNPAASYALLDTKKSEITYLRIPYDIEAAAAKIRLAGLPDSLADRLRRGH
ncbi:MAG: metallophosphoesterase family protein [Holophagaceae bacterium]|nr:metallophosphoesterase family protein [Holophagaceae bacterium]